MAADRARPDRRSVLRIGGGVVALAIGVGAGIVDRRHRGGSSDGTLPRTPSSPPAPPTSSRTATATRPATAADVPDLADIVVPDVPDTVVAIGRTYLEAAPSEADLATLVRLLPPDGGDVVAAAAAAVAADFRTGSIVVLDGWVLAESEARAAAILALVCSPSC